MEQAIPCLFIGYMVARELKATRLGRGRRWTLTAKRLAKLLMLLLGAKSTNSAAVPTTTTETNNPTPWEELMGKRWVGLSLLMVATVASVNAIGAAKHMRHQPGIRWGEDGCAESRIEEGQEQDESGNSNQESRNAAGGEGRRPERITDLTERGAETVTERGAERQTTGRRATTGRGRRQGTERRKAP